MIQQAVTNRNPGGARRLLPFLLLAVVVAGFHGRSLKHGLFMDDYAHFRQLQAADWSLKGLADACRLELVGGVVDIWWLPETTLRFFRPVSFGLMKFAYTIVDWQAMPMHVVSLLWHLTTCSLLFLLLKRLSVAAGLAWCLAALFAIHPGNVACVQWIACQSELMVTAFLLAATLAFARYRQWGVDVEKQADRANWCWLVVSVIFFAAALGCRENAIMFPAVIFAAEWGRRKEKPLPWKFFAVLAVVAVIYLGVRSWTLGGTQLPPRPYVIPPTAPDFPRFVFDKLGYYLLGEFFLAPIVPMGGVPFLRDRAVMFYVAYAVIIIGLAVLVWRRRRTRIAAVAPTWLILMMLPVLPAFASPHHLYLPGVGWTLFIAMIVKAIAGKPGRESVKPRLRLAMANCMILGLAVMFSLNCFIFTRYALDTAQQVEDAVVDAIVTASVPVREGDTLYIANLPVIAHYTQLAVEDRTGVKGLRVVPLTWSPRLLGVESDAEWTLVDDHTLEIRVKDHAYFEGTLGTLVAESMGKTPQSLLVEPYAFKDFNVEWIEQNDDRIQSLRFIFSRSLMRDGIHFFWGSRSAAAYQVLPERISHE